MRRRTTLAPLAVALALLPVLAGCGTAVRPLPAPENVIATATGGGVHVAWQDRSANEEGFIIYRIEGEAASSTADAAPGVEIARTGPDVEAYTDHAVVETALYSYAVRAFAGSRRSAVAVQLGAPTSPTPMGLDPIVVSSLDGGTAAEGAEACTLRDAIAAANTDAPVGACDAGHGDDTIELPTGATVVLTELDNRADRGNALPAITSTIVIHGHTGTLRIGNGASGTLRLFDIAAGGDLTLRDITLLGGRDSSDDASADLTAAVIYNRGSLHLVNVTVEGSSAGGWGADGGAIANHGGSVAIEGGAFIGNTLECGNGCGGAALVTTGGAVVIDGTRFAGNETSGDDASGALDVRGGRVRVVDCVFVDNRAAYGAAISNAGILEIQGGSFERNLADVGGAVNNVARLSIRGTSFAGNAATTFGGALLNGRYAVTTIAAARLAGANPFFDEEAQLGGAVYNLGDLTLQEGTEIRGVQASSGGGAIYNDGGAVVARAVNLRGNQAGFSSVGRGGAIESAGGTIELHDTDLVNNGSQGDGGGIYAEGAVLIAGGRLAGNSAGGNGGAVYQASGGLTLDGGVSLTLNRAASGGAVYLAPGTTYDPVQAVIEDNTPDDVAP